MSNNNSVQNLNLIKVFIQADYLIAGNTNFFAEISEYFFENVFRISTSFRQLFFSLFNLPTTFYNLFSTGVILKGHANHFNFFNSSMISINPLVMTIRFAFVPFFNNLYAIESLNYTKRQFTFLNNFISSINTELKYMIFSKAWEHTTKPVNSINRRVVKLLSNL